jgi:hypothetical protein
MNNWMTEWRGLALDARRDLISAETYCMYFAGVAKRYRQLDRLARFIIAAFACAPLIAKITQVSATTASWIVALVPLVAISLPIWNPSKTSEDAAVLHGKYNLFVEYLKNTWRSIKNPPSDADHEKVFAAVKAQLTDIGQQLAATAQAHAHIPDVHSIKAAAKIDTSKYAFDDARYETGILPPTSSQGSAPAAASAVASDEPLARRSAELQSRPAQVVVPEIIYKVEHDPKKFGF